MEKLTKALTEFANATDAQAQRDALVALIKAKQIHKAAARNSFRDGLEQMAGSIGSAASNQERLLTVAALQRVAAAAPSIKTFVESLVRDAIVEPLSGLHDLPSVHDRLYAVRSWCVGPNAWRLNDLAIAAAQEATGEAVRRECILAITGLAQDVREALSALRRALHTVKFETKKPGDSFGRRLNRVLAALTEVISQSDMQVGEDPGNEICQLVNWKSFFDVCCPETESVRVDVAEHVARLIHAIIRVDFLNGSKGETYEALSLVSSWFSESEWQAVCKSSMAILLVKEDLRRAILLLAGAGKTDSHLRVALETAAGSRKAADTVCRRLVVEHSEIPDEVQDWLVRSPKRVKVDTVTEIHERSIDQVIAEILVTMKKLSRASEIVRDDVIPEVSILLPQSEHAISRLIGMTEMMANILDLAVVWRSLRVRGNVGEIVEFSPFQHQFEPGTARTRHVRLLSPVVERLSDDGVPRVVLKAAVEPTLDQQKATVGG